MTEANVSDTQRTVLPDTQRTAELRLMEHLTALLLWCDRLHAHPGYAALTTRHQGLPSYLQRGKHFALSWRAALLSGHLESRQTPMEEAIARLQAMLTSLQGLERGLHREVYNASNEAAHPQKTLN